MVLSASMITSYRDDGSTYSVFLDQAKFAAIGVVGAIVAAHGPGPRGTAPGPARSWSAPRAAAAGVHVVRRLGQRQPQLDPPRPGSRCSPPSWSSSGSILVGAAVLAASGKLPRRASSTSSSRSSSRSSSSPSALVLMGHDLGTALVLIGDRRGAALRRRASRRGSSPSRPAVFAAVGERVRRDQPEPDGPHHVVARQLRHHRRHRATSPIHGLYALADGGWWGVGLGASREKWSWLPEAHNDFIFAIIGEELGLPGTLVILVLFALLAWACYRLVQRIARPVRPRRDGRRHGLDPRCRRSSTSAR